MGELGKMMMGNTINVITNVIEDLTNQSQVSESHLTDLIQCNTKPDGPMAQFGIPAMQVASTDNTPTTALRQDQTQIHIMQPATQQTGDPRID